MFVAFEAVVRVCMTCALRLEQHKRNLLQNWPLRLQLLEARWNRVHDHLRRSAQEVAKHLRLQHLRLQHLRLQHMNLR